MLQHVFPVRRTFRGLRFFIAADSVFILFGAVLFLGGEPWGVWLLGFAVLLEILILLQASRPGWRYTMDMEGIGVRRPTGSRVMRREEIAAVEAVDGARVVEVLAGPQWAEAKAGPAMDFKEGLRARKEISRIVGFSSVSIILTQTRSKGSLIPRQVSAKAPGRFVLITMRNGDVRVLSPRDVDGFVQAWKAPIRFSS